MKNIEFLRDVNGITMMIVSYADRVDVIIYTDTLTRIEIKKNSPNGEKILSQKIKEGIVTAADLLKLKYAA